MNTRTILFDLDGTLIDTNQLIVESFKHTFDHFKLDFTDEEIIEFNGPPLVETFKKIDPVRADEMVATYRAHNHLYHDQFVTAFPNVLEALQGLKENNIKMGIVTTKLTRGVEMGLKRTGLTDFFDSVVTLDDVTHAKPHPEPVLKAMEDLGGESRSTIMVGDNSHDIESGHNAGVRTAAVSWSQKGRDRLLAYKPTYMLDKMTDLLQIVGV
ncbi:pyrophosphatase PpaX [Oceanobacillus alkalisoli]|uniref:pyrophosphatase PpaX n=1 Tax=Oceanobacillus alkalisoli TaxID=2925113 RepID=UPI001EEFC83A|nr:pyrophosphatase PpaX [Oceanobacillus alkalisoli]MCF3942151.1 pyrophosphatase PpaX [Oceanobacillus alkalisoli]MCG5104385.1 pyrophosphatase PpaX [Oceanobacillus alkalisoli]